MIPAELRALAQWVLWGYETVNGRETKVPYTLHGRRASSTNPQTWASYDAVLAARNGYDGIGFVLSPTDPYVGFDLDLCVDEDGGIHDAACDVVEAVDSYCEFSPSGRGLRILARGKLSSDRHETPDVPWADFCPQDGRKPEFAVFSEGRYFTLTGEALDDFETIRDRQAQIDDIVTEYLPSEPRRTRPDEPQRETDTSLSGQDFAIACEGVRAGLSNEEITEEIRRNRDYDPKSHRKDYIARTIRKARKAIESPVRYQGRHIDLAPLFAAAPRPIPWRVEGLVADGTLTVISGESGAGKSWLAQALCVGVTYGEPVITDLVCRRGRALYVDGEMGPEMFVDHRLRPAGFTEPGFEYIDALGLDFSTPADLNWLAGKIEEIGANLVVIDSLRALTPSRGENDSDDMAPTISGIRKLARDTRAASILIHHKGDGPKWWRGSSTIRDQTDALFGLLTDEEGSGILTLSCKLPKGKPPRYAAPPLDLYLRVALEEGGIAQTGPPDSPKVKINPSHGLADRIKIHFRGLLQLATLKPGSCSNVDLTLSQVARAMDVEPTNGTLRLALDRLVSQDYLERGEDKRYRPTPLFDEAD